MGKLNICSCGNKPRLTHVYEPTGDVLTPYSVVICDKCNNVTKKSYDSDEEAINAWNQVVKPYSNSIKNDIHKITTIEENIQYLLSLKLIMKHDIKDKIKMKGIDSEGKKAIGRMTEAVDSGIKALSDQAKYEKALWNAVEDYEMEYGCMDDERKKEKINKWKHEAGLED